MMQSATIQLRQHFNYCKMNLTMSSILVVALALLSFCKLTTQLECYVCVNQENNKNKCVETVKTCDLDQDQCLSEVRWSSTPAWALTSQKQYYISKRCATKDQCQDAIADRYNKCDRIWYNDWNCTTCCSGDKCNYFVTLGARSLQPYATLTLLSISTIMYILYFLNPRSV